MEVKEHYRALGVKIERLIDERARLMRKAVTNSEAWKEYLAYPDWKIEPDSNRIHASEQSCEESPVGVCVFDLPNDPGASACLFCGREEDLFIEEDEDDTD